MNTIGSTSQISYSVGSSDLRLPSQTPNFTPGSNLYSGSNDSNVTFTAAPANFGGGIQTSTDSQGAPLSSQLQGILSGKDTRSPKLIGASSEFNLQSISNIPSGSPQENRAYKPNVVDGSVFSGSGFKPVPMTLYRVEPTTTFSFTPFSAPLGGSLTQSTTFGRSLLSPSPTANGVPAARNDVAAPQRTTNRFTQPGGVNFTQQQTRQAFSEWASELHPERIRDYSNPTKFNPIDDTPYATPSDQAAFFKLRYLSKAPSAEGERAQALYDRLDKAIRDDYDDNNAVSKTALNGTRNEIQTLLRDAFGSEPIAIRPATPDSGQSITPRFSKSPELAQLYSAQSRTDATSPVFSFLTPRGAIPTLNLSASPNNNQSIFTRTVGAPPTNSTEYYVAQGRAMNAIGTMPSVERDSQLKRFSQVTGLPATEQAFTAALSSPGRKILNKFGSYLLPEAKAQLAKDPSERFFFLPDQDFLRVARSQQPDLYEFAKDEVGRQIDAPSGRFANFNSSTMSQWGSRSTFAHESLHSVDSPKYSEAIYNDDTLNRYAPQLIEGVTDVLTGKLGYQSGSYPNESKFVNEVLVPKVGWDTILRAYFQGDKASIEKIKQALPR